MQHRRGKLFQPGPPPADRYRHAKGHAELRLDHVGRVIGALGRLTDHRNARFQHTDGDAADIIGSQLMALHEVQDRINRGLGVATTGVGFDCGVQNLEVTAQAGGQPAGIGIVGVGFEKAVPALKNRGRSDKAGLGQQRGVNTAEGRPTRMEPFGPGAFGQKLHRAGGLAAGNTDGGQQLVGTQPQQPAGADRRPERAAGRGRMKATGVVSLGADRHGQTRRRLKAGHPSAEKGRPARPELLGHGQGCGKHAHPQMD